MKPLTLTRVAPTGYQPSLFGPETPIYPQFNRSRGDQLRALRQDMRLSEGAAAYRLAIQTHELTAIERGELACDYAEATARMGRHRSDR